jgi:hypothetical protein
MAVGEAQLMCNTLPSLVAGANDVPPAITISTFFFF